MIILILDCSSIMPGDMILHIASNDPISKLIAAGSNNISQVHKYWCCFSFEIGSSYCLVNVQRSNLIDWGYNIHEAILLIIRLINNLAGLLIVAFQNS